VTLAQLGIKRLTDSPENFLPEGMAGRGGREGATVGTEVETTEFPGGQLVPDKASEPAPIRSCWRRNATPLASVLRKPIFHFTFHIFHLPSVKIFVR
jgi:hypothetical protein